MQEVFKKPYELSVWEDILIPATEGKSSYYKEKKIAVIGSDKMDSPNKAYDIVLKKNINGEINLTFSLAYKYFDSGVGDVVTNPFANYLINERKIKLFYDEKWYDFVIKECEEDSSSMVFTYTAVNLFVQELSKVGYNIILDRELNNNQGTAVELAKKAVEGTDWVVDENSDLLQQYIKEPLYLVTVTTSFDAINLDTNETETIAVNEYLYVFYSYIANKDGTYLQFLRQREQGGFTEDSTGAYKGTNYRYEGTPTITDTTIEGIGTIGDIYTSHQGYRLVYKQSTTYDSIMKRTVERYLATFSENDTQEIYKYTDYEYTTSDIVKPLVTNGSNFNVYENGTLQGWSAGLGSNYGETNIPEVVPLNLTTYPLISTTTNVVKITNFAKINGYLETKLGQNQYIFNSGFEDNSSVINRIVKGEQYLLRVRGGYSDSQHDTLNNFSSQNCVRAVVAKYENYIPEDGYYYNGKLIKNVPIKRMLSNGVILEFTGTFNIKNNEITDGVFDADKKHYRINTVIQEPSTRYVYKEGKTGFEYIWDSDNQVYIAKTSSNFSNYYYTVATAQQAVSTDEFKTGDARIGIFIYVNSGLYDKWVYINDIQITRYYEDGDNPAQPLLIGNVPVARSISTDYFYLKPVENAVADEINQYHDLEALSDELGTNNIEPIYNENCEKILSINESKSNCFNILQSICETFECWLELRVFHDEQGYLKTNSDGAPIKQVVLREYAGKDNYAGFRYGINLDSIQRNVVSNEFVTKLIVENTVSDYTKSGSLSIQDAPSNPSLESYILDFSYYQNRGLIANVDDSNADLYNFYINVRAANEAYQEASKKFAELEASITEVKAKRSVYNELIEAASNKYLKARKKFIDLTNMDYDDYVEQQEEDSKIEDQNIADTISELYACSSTINNYSGLLTNLNEEYKKLMLECYGERDYSLVITTVPVENEDGSTKVTLNDYFDGVQFTVFIDTTNNEIAEQDITGPNERIFNYDRVYDKIKINSLPEGYQIVYLDNNYETTYGEGAIFPIYATGGKTTRLRLTPSGTRAESAQDIADRLLKEKEAIEKDFYKSYSRFIQEGTWSSTNYVDPELYYLDALQISRVSAQPKVSYSIKVLEISELEGFGNYNFDVGDKTYIEDTEFFGYINEGFIEDGESNEDIVLTPVREEVIVSEAEWHLDNPDENSITVQNYKDEFEDLFQRLTATVQSVQYNEPAYSRMASKLDANGLINSNTLISSLNKIAGSPFNITQDGGVSVNDGLLMRSLTSGNKQVKIDSEGIAISEDGGENWTYVINSIGVNTDELTTGQLNTQKIDILDGENPSFRWDKNGLSAYGLNETVIEGESPYDLKTFVRFDKYGLYGIQNNEDFIASNLGQIKDNANFGITWDGFFIRNKYRNGYVSISSEDDFQIVGNTTERYIIGNNIKTAVFEVSS